ncbi:hypothetical protein J6590_090564 [Homalodisca vitripennis]|nr:hypothetical protein J6590_090564 [Homalodisca vitripennis]
MCRAIERALHNTYRVPITSVAVKEDNGLGRLQWAVHSHNYKDLSPSVQNKSCLAKADLNYVHCDKERCCRVTNTEY